MNISFFPTAYPDEDYRSIIYRYHVLSGNNNFEVTNREVFGRGSNTNNTLPRNLKYLLDQLPNRVLSPDTFLLNHTFYYWVKPFIPKVRISQVLDEIMNNKGSSNISSLLGRGKERFICEHLRYCPTCMKNDEKTYGEVYLHRIHQPAFLSFCPLHGDKLLSHCPICGKILVDSENGKLVVALEGSCGHTLVGTMKKEISLRKRSERKLYLNFMQFIKHSNNISRDKIILKMKNILGVKKYIKYSGNIERTKLFQDFKKYLLANDLESSLPINIQAQLKTDSFILLGKGVKNVLFYILLMMFLSGSVKMFLRDNSSFSLPIPFGNGPWICENRVCMGEDHAVIKKCVRVDRVGKYISGLFCCPLCGFSFARRWELGERRDDKPYAVLTMGHLWLSTLHELHEKGLSNNQISKRLKITPTQIQRALMRFIEPSSDTRILQALNMLAVNGDSNAEVASTSEDEKQTYENREKVKSILHKHTGITRKEISKKHNHLYHKMLKHDREWMEEVLPPSKKGKRRISWNKLDKEYYGIICEASDALYISNPREKIKKYTILAHVPNIVKGHLERSPENFPQTTKLLMNKLESDEHYLLRHLPEIIKQMKKYSKKAITLERIKTYSPMYRKSSMELDERLTEELERCNNNIENSNTVYQTTSE